MPKHWTNIGPTMPKQCPLHNPNIIKNKPSYLTEAWLPEVEELLDDKGVGLSVNDRFGFDDGNGSVCVWYC